MRRPASIVVSVFVCVLGGSRTSSAQVRLTPDTAPPPLQNVQTITIDASAGSHFDPHVDGNLISYTSNPLDGTPYYVRYFRFGVDASPTEIPHGPDTLGNLSRPSGTRLAYSHVDDRGVNIRVFDTAQPLGSGNPFDIDPQPGANRYFANLHGDTAAYMDCSLNPNCDAVVFDLSTNTSTRVTSDSAINGYLRMSPDGNALVWQHCPTDPNSCDIWKAERSGGWAPSIVIDDPAPETWPDSNGTITVYASDRPSASDSDIFYRDAAGVEYELALPGRQAAPRVAGDFITFEGQTADGSWDIFLYQISTKRVWNVTTTPGVDELLSDISILPNGDVIVVYPSTERSARFLNAHAVTFTVPPVTPVYSVCPLYDATKAKKSGSTFPIQIRLCDANGGNLSSSSIVVNATGVTQVSTNAPGTLEDAGNSNPDFDFRFDATTSSYIFNLKTTGFATGTYSLSFVAGADPAVHTAMFQIK